MRRKRVKHLEEHDHYDVYEELWHYDDGNAPHSIKMTSAYNKEGDWIGSAEFAKRLAEFGIKPELAHPDDSVCSVGWSEKTQRYYGWSHRAIFGFEYGDKIFEESFAPFDSNVPFSQHGTRTIVTKAQAREAAINFADHVG